jgi:hypothetical protein
MAKVNRKDLLRGLFGANSRHWASVAFECPAMLRQALPLPRSQAMPLFRKAVMRYRTDNDVIQHANIHQL